jgi:hypothetical protein
MWSRFTVIVHKAVYTLQFDRSFPTDPERVRALCDKLVSARATRSIVVTTPEAIKSLTLKMVEMHHSNCTADLHRLVGMEESNNKREKEKYAKHQAMLETGDELAKVIDLWSARQGGVLLMDEVDLLLHPLRSELNFPMGKPKGKKQPIHTCILPFNTYKQPINTMTTFPHLGKPIKKDVDLSPQRWELPIHILDALFYCELGYISVPGFDQSAEGGALLQELRQAVSAGIESKFLINTPHLVLLEVTYDKDSSI